MMKLRKKVSVINYLGNLKTSKLHIDKEIYKIARYEVHKLISCKNIFFFENRLNDSFVKPKELLKALKSLGLPSQTSVCRTTALKVKNIISFETEPALYIFKNDYCVLADSFWKRLPTPLKRYTFNSVIQYYRHFIQTDAFHLTYSTEIDKEKNLRSRNVSKATGIDDLSVIF